VIGDQITEQVNSFDYLGCNLSHISSRDIDKKLAKFQQLIDKRKRTLFRIVRPETVIKFYKTSALPTLLYGSGAWTLTSVQIKGIEIAEMKLLRPLAGHTLSDHVRNEDIRQKLETESVTYKISTYRNNWPHHMERMTPERIPYKLLNINQKGIDKEDDRRNVGKFSSKIHNS
jgi:hypothetical protein